MEKENKNKPYIVKPNLFELEQYAGKKFDAANDGGLREIFDEVGKIHRETGVIVLCTLGERGAVCCGPDGVYYVPAPKVTVRGFAGAGDTFLAAYCAAHFGLFDFDGIDAAAFAALAAAAKVEKPGTDFPSVGEIREIRGRITGK
jgi:1-phosphofructokinase